MADLILTASIAVFLWAVVGLVAPGRAWIPSRVAAVGVWVLSVILLVIGTNMLPDDPDVPTTLPASGGAATIETRILDALSAGNRDIERVNEAGLQGERLIVQWAINDSLTANLIQASARRDIRDMLEAIASSSESYTTVFLRGTFSMVDQLGNASETTVIEATYTKDTIDRINFQNFRVDNVFAIAEDSQVHPGFK